MAEIKETIKLSDIKDNVVQIDYKDDGWGNSGNFLITFDNDTIVCKFDDIVEDKLANWGFFEDTITMIKDDEAHKKMEYTPEEYEELYPSQPTYDMSKASGILASKGMTEDEFRASCQLLKNGNSDKIRATQEILDYPAQ